MNRAAFYAACSVVNVILFELANGIHFVVDNQRGQNVHQAKKQADGKSG